MQPADNTAGWDWSWLAPDINDPRRQGRANEYEAYKKAIGGGVDPFAWLGNFFGGGSDEDKLTNEILDKMGGSVQPGGKASPPNAARIMEARRAAHQAMIDPAYRRQLATSLGWNLNNPHVQYFLQHGTNLPSDPTSTGGGTAAPAAGAQPGAAGATTPGALAAPFDPKAWGGRAGDPGFTYGALLPPNIAAAAGVDRQWGVDYALPMGTALNAPFAGTVIYAGNNGPYGNTVVIRLSNGVTYRVAHLSAMNVTVGQQVGVGGVLGAVGSTGNSTGPHVLIEMRDSAGNPIDPTPILDTLLKPGADMGVNGDAYRKYQDLLALVSGQPQYIGQVVPFKTPDGHWIYPGSSDYNVYAAVQSLWKKRYGGDPPWSFVSSQIAAGNTTTEQIQNAMDQMSSDIPNMNWGQRDAFASDANNAALKAWSRPLPDATLKELAGKGLTNAGQLQNWVASHPASAIDPQTFAQIYDQTNQETQPLWQQPPSPDLVKMIHDKMQAGPTGA